MKNSSTRSDHFIDAAGAVVAHRRAINCAFVGGRMKGSVELSESAELLGTGERLTNLGGALCTVHNAPSRTSQLD